MGRTIAEPPKGTRITDYIRLGVLAATFPLPQVGAVLGRPQLFGFSAVESGPCSGRRPAPADQEESALGGGEAPAGGFVIYPSARDRRHPSNGVVVRVIAYRLEGVAEAEPQGPWLLGRAGQVRLLTTSLDPSDARAGE
ncbi:MAG: hypothetical protein WAO35_14900 [Terriglobia bacterium]